MAVTLPKVSSGGFTAYVDAVAWESQSYGYGYNKTTYDNLHFLSMLGPTQTVRALWARAMAGEKLLLTGLDDREISVSLGYIVKDTWKLTQRPLPNATGSSHLIIAHVKANYLNPNRHEWYTFPRNEAEAPLLFYRFLDRRITVPLHPSWMGWLWALALKKEWAKPLRTFAADGRFVAAYKCYITGPFDIESEIAQAVASGVLKVEVVQ